MTPKLQRTQLRLRHEAVFARHCEERSDEAIQPWLLKDLDCFAEPVIGRRFAPTRWLAMTANTIRSVGR
jgi:hypothetical protein